MRKLASGRLCQVLATLICSAGICVSQIQTGDGKPTAEELAFQQIQGGGSRRGRIISDEPLTEKDKTWNHEVGHEALELANRARKFVTDFPESGHHKQAQIIEREQLLLAAQTGDETAQERLDGLIQEALKQSGLDEEDRVYLRWMAIQNSVSTRNDEGQRALTPELEKLSRQLIQEFPTRPEPYWSLMSLVHGSEDLRVVKEILASSQAPAEVKQRATGMLRLYHLPGHAPDMRFTALDGREVDLTTPKGKVTLVDFWATWCGPCVAELPHIKQTYDKFHDQGFEVVGISLDQDKPTLLKFIKSKGLPWPQYFDGQGWQNRYAQNYGIDSIPAMWLINRHGNVVDLNASEDLAAKVERLLAAKPAKP